MYQFRRGLMRAIEDKIMQSEPQPQSLEATIAMAARTKGPMEGGPRHGRGISCTD